MSQPPITQQLTFLHTNDLDETRKFYTEVLGLPLVRDQGICHIFRVTETAFLGFCEHIEPMLAGRKVILTLVSDDVDVWYDVLTHRGVEMMGPPEASPKFQIYHFFFKDPNGYWIEIQKFDQPL